MTTVKVLFATVTETLTTNIEANDCNSSASRLMSRDNVERSLFTTFLDFVLPLSIETTAYALTIGIRDVDILEQEEVTSEDNW